MSRPKSSDYQVRFSGVLLVALAMAAVGWWALESGFRVVAASALITFVLVWLYALVTWGLWWQARKARRAGRGDDA